MGTTRTIGDNATPTVAGSVNGFNTRAPRVCDLSTGDDDILVSDLAQMVPDPLHARIACARFSDQHRCRILKASNQTHVYRATSESDAERVSSGSARAHNTSRWKMLFSPQFRSSVTPVNGMYFA